MVKFIQIIRLRLFLGVSGSTKGDSLISVYNIRAISVPDLKRTYITYYYYITTRFRAFRNSPEDNARLNTKAVVNDTIYIIQKRAAAGIKNGTDFGRHFRTARGLKKRYTDK